MSLNVGNLVHLTILAATFGFVLSLWMAVVLLWSIRRGAREKAIRQRVVADQGEPGPKRPLRLWHEGREAVIERPAMHKTPLAQRIRIMFREAGWELDLRFFSFGSIAMVAMALMFSFAATGNFLPGVGAIVLTAFVFWFLLQRRIIRRSALFDIQFVDALDMAARSLRAGHPLIGGFQLISREIPAPIGTLFAEICQAQEMGRGIEQAILEVANSYNNADVRIFGTAIAIQIRSGGNLADIMERLSYVIRDRMRLNRRVRVLTAQTQFSKRILAGLPVLVFFLLNALNPTYMTPLYTTDTGKSLLAMAVILVVAGVWLMNRISIIRY